MWTSKAVSERRRGYVCALALGGIAGGLTAGTTHAAIVHSLSKGTSGHGLAHGAPGTPIEIDFRTLNGIPAAQPPVYAWKFTVTYDFGDPLEPASGVKFQLSTGDIFSLPLMENGTQGVFSWYTNPPTYSDPNSTPRGLMPAGLRAELSDGVLSARLWAEGTSADFYHFPAILDYVEFELSDLASLAAHYGSPSQAVFSDGDLDGDGDVDLNDLGVLATHYPGGQAQASADLQALGFGELSNAVPEPAAGSLVLVACAGLAMRRPRGRQSTEGNLIA